MEIKFLIENKATDGSTDIPKLGIVEGYIQEAINQVTLIELYVVSDLALDEDACEDLIGQNATLALGDLTDKQLLWSRFDGVIYEISVLDEYEVEHAVFGYKMVIRSALWNLNFHTHYRSFANASRIDVVEKLLTSHKMEKTVKFDASYFAADKDYPPVVQIVQNETTDLVFFKQLLSEGGINFYFSAAKDGETPEILKLADHNVFFQSVWKNDILWNPPAGMVAPKQQVTSFETHLCTTPAAVETKADFGDGMVRTFQGSGEVPDGKGGEHQLFTREGQNIDVSKHTANVLTDGFTASKITYEGTSNHLAIRSGEKVSIKGHSSSREKKILVTSVRHVLKQTVPSATNDNVDLSYENIFSAVRMDAPVRPPQLFSTHLMNTVNSSRDKFPGRQMDKMLEQLEATLDVKLDKSRESLPYFNVQETMLTLLERLMRKSSLSGLWVGEVVENAKVTENGELTCRIANEQFPEGEDGGGLTAKVALGWLTNEGWFSVLPRKGNYVYFIFMQGEGGQNEAVVIGYRSTGAVKTLDPAKTQTTPKLKVGEPPALGKAAEKVVEKDDYEPSNRQRNTLRGEAGVAEIAVIDGGDAAVAIHANNAVHMVADQEIHTDAPVQCQNADELHQQLGLVNRGVTGDQKESVGGNHEMTVMGNQSEFIGESHKRHVEKEIVIDNNGDDDITIANGENTTLILHKGEQAILKADDDNALSIANSGVADLKSGSDVNIAAGQHTAVVNQDGIQLTVGGNTLTIAKDGNIELNAVSAVSITGKSQVEINATGSVSINGNMEVSISGATVNIN